MTQTIDLSDYRGRTRRVYFDRSELSRLMALYSTRVSRGEWRDYAIDHVVGAAVFSVFRHTMECPLLSIAKLTRGRSTDYVLTSGRQRLTRSADLDDIITYLDRQLHLVAGR